MKYLPFLDGKYSTAPALNAMAKAVDSSDQFIFQIDEQYDTYMANKLSCRKENISKYYLESALSEKTIAAVNRLIVEKLIAEYPLIFSLEEQNNHFVIENKLTGSRLQWNQDWIYIENKVYHSLFDALCSQVQEDIAICQLDGEKDWLSAIHLSSPNHWAPADKIGRPFGFVHGVVPGMEKLNQQYFKMLQTVVHKGPFFRFAWGIATDIRLNHHPDPPPGIDPIYWQGRKVEADNKSIYLRVERQTTTGIPLCSAFLFTIRTYFYDIAELTENEKNALFLAVQSMSEQALAYKGLTDKVEMLERRLQS